MSGNGNLARMKTLDDAWNAQDWDVFRKRHSADTEVFWPGQPQPTRGRQAMMPTWPLKRARWQPRKSGQLRATIPARGPPRPHPLSHQPRQPPQPRFLAGVGDRRTR